MIVAVVWPAWYFIKKIPAVIYVLDRAKVHLPKLGRLFKVIYTARFARTLSSLYSSGIPIINCLSIAKKTIGNAYIEAQFDQVIADTQAGEPLSVALGKVDGFIAKMISSVRVGEEAGSLESMLNSIADDMEFESERAIQQMVAMIEPVMIIVMAVIVGFIMISVIVPIYQSYSTIGAGSM
jgi:type IV pilus assembly protein PilC